MPTIGMLLKKNLVCLPILSSKDLTNYLEKTRKQPEHLPLVTLRLF